MLFPPPALAKKSHTVGGFGGALTPSSNGSPSTASTSAAVNSEQASIRLPPLIAGNLSQQGRPGLEAETVSAASTQTRLDSLELLEGGHQIAQDRDQALVVEGRRV